MGIFNSEELNKVTGGAGRQRDKFVSAFYCEYCRKTIHLNMVYSLDAELFGNGLADGMPAGAVFSADGDDTHVLRLLTAVL